MAAAAEFLGATIDLTLDSEQISRWRCGAGALGKGQALIPTTDPAAEVDLRDPAAGLGVDSPGCDCRMSLSSGSRPIRNQPCQHFDEEALVELVHSLREVGAAAAHIVVRPVGAGYEIVAGSGVGGRRRKRVGDHPGGGARDRRRRPPRDALLENLHRVQLNPLKEALATSSCSATSGSRRRRPQTVDAPGRT